MSKQYANLTGQAIEFDLATAGKMRKTNSILSRRTRRSERRLARAL